MFGSGRNVKKDDAEYVPVRSDDGWSDRSVTDDMDLEVDTLVEVRCGAGALRGASTQAPVPSSRS